MNVIQIKKEQDDESEVPVDSEDELEEKNDLHKRKTFGLTVQSAPSRILKNEIKR
jgi:hypothetical protein